MYERAREALPVPADAAFWVPGRVEFLGKHTDYAGGRSLLCAVERGICILITRRADRRIRIVDAARPEDILETTIDAGASGAPGHWSNYPLTVVRAIARDFESEGSLRGAEIAFASDLPLAAGMSSSSALVVATFLAMANVNSLKLPSTEELAGYLGAVETGVGTTGGSEDHTAIMCARPNALVQYSFCPVRFEREIPLPNDHVLVIATSGVAAEKIGAARDRYNGLSAAMRTIIARSRDAGARAASFGDIVDTEPDTVDRLMNELDGPLRDRFAHFVLESGELIPAAGDALLRGDLEQLGALVDRSQEGAERLLRNQIPETMWLAREARERGAVAASAFGAGFGGSVWALLPTEQAEVFRAIWAEQYALHFPVSAANAMFFITRAGPPAARL